jgi:hypothetical protein
MRLAAIHLARAMALVEPIDLNPTGKAFYPDLVKALVLRYGFLKFPQKPEEFDEVKGVVFSTGKFEDTSIEQLIIYTYGLLVDTRVSTQESRRVLEEAMEWASKALGLKYSEIRRWQYASQVTFYSEIDLTSVHPAMQRLADSVSRNVAEITAERLKYELTAFAIDYDSLTRKHPMGRFSIQRRENTPFSEHKYFSDAPLPTEVHLMLVQQFEDDVSKGRDV